MTRLELRNLRGVRLVVVAPVMERESTSGERRAHSRTKVKLAMTVGRETRVDSRPWEGRTAGRAGQVSRFPPRSLRELLRW